VGPSRRPSLFFRMRGVLCASLTFLYAAVFVSLLGDWLSDETLPFFRLAVLGLLYLPFLWTIPVIGAVAGIVLARGIAPEAINLRARLQRAVLPLVLSVAPLSAILGIAHCFPPSKTEVSKATLPLSDEVLADFNAGDGHYGH